MNYTINEIPDEAVELSGNEMIPIWQGETKKVSVATLANATKGYIRDQNILSEWEAITLPTSASDAITMDYDGYITCGAGRDTSIYIYVDGHVEATNVCRTSEYAQPSINGFPFKKGQSIYVRTENGPLDTNLSRVAYYKLRDYTGR